MRVVIAEDSVLLQAGLTKLLSDGGFEVVAAVPDADQLLRAVAEHRPDVAGSQAMPATTPPPAEKPAAAILAGSTPSRAWRSSSRSAALPPLPWSRSTAGTARSGR